MIARTTFFVLSVLAMSAAMFSAKATTVFNINDWDGTLGAVENVQTSPSVTVFNVSTPSSGGNPGSHVFVDTRLVGSSASTSRFIPFAGAVYDPSAQGAILSFDFSIDQKADAYGNGAHGWGIGLKQGANYYLLNLFSRYRFSATPSNQLIFHTFAETGLDMSDFMPWVTGGALDVSASGAPIQIGLAIFSGNGGAPSRQDRTRYDNFSLTLTTASEPVPTPGAFAVLVSGLYGLAAAVRRR